MLCVRIRVADCFTNFWFIALDALPRHGQIKVSQGLLATNFGWNPQIADGLTAGLLLGFSVTNRLKRRYSYISPNNWGISKPIQYILLGTNQNPHSVELQIFEHKQIPTSNLFLRIFNTHSPLHLSWIIWTAPYWCFVLESLSFSFFQRLNKNALLFRPLNINFGGQTGQLSALFGSFPVMKNSQLTTKN